MKKRAHATIFCCGALLLAGAGCEQPCQAVVLQVSGTPAGTQTLRARGTLDGVPAMQAVDFGGDLGKIALQIDPAKRGALKVALDALDAAGCVLSSGEGTIPLDGQCVNTLAIPLPAGGERRREVTVRLGGLPKEAVKLRYIYALGAAAPSKVEEVAAGASLIVRAGSGPLSVYVEGISKDGCVVARGGVESASSEGCQVALDVPMTDLGPDGQLCACSEDGWCREHPRRENHVLRDVYGRSDKDIWAVGDGGLVLHHDGQSWQRVPSGTTRDLHGVWGNETLGVWVVGEEGTVLRYQGGGFSPQVPGAGQNWYGVWGQQDALWIVGDEGAVSRYTEAGGFEVKRAKNSAEQPLRGIWGSEKDRPWVVGGHYNQSPPKWAGVILNWDGAKWIDRTNLIGTSGIMLRRIWGRDQNNIWIAGGCWPFVTGPACSTRGMAWRFDGAAPMASMTPVYTSTTVALGAVWGQGADVLLAGGDPDERTGSLCRITGGAGACVAVPNTDAPLLHGGWGKVAVGELGAVIGDGGEALSPDAAERGRVRATIDGLWAEAPDRVWAVGGDGSAGLVWLYEGRTWRRMNPMPAPGVLHGVTADAGTVWMVGDKGAIWRVQGVNGATLTLEPAASPTTLDLLSIWAGRGTAWAAGGGYKGTPPPPPVLLKNQGGGWLRESVVGAPTSGVFHRVTGNQAGEVWVGGGETANKNQGVNFRFDPVAMSWKSQDLNKSEYWPSGMWSGAGQEVLIGGDDHTRNSANLVRSRVDGNIEIARFTLDAIQGLWGRAPDQVWAVGGTYQGYKRYQGQPRGEIFFYDGKTAVAQQSGTNYLLSAVTGVGLGNVWAAGQGGTLLRRRLVLRP